MTSLILKDLKFRWLFAVGSVIVLLLVAAATETYSYLEMSYFMYPIICCCLLFGNATEIELIRTSNTRLSAVLMMRYIMTYFFTAFPAAAVLLFVNAENGVKSAVALVTTLLFTTSFSLLARVITANPYGAVLFSLIVHTVAVASFKVILVALFNISKQKTLQRFDPYYAEQISNKGVFINNRLIVTGAALAVILIAYIIMRRREKFYAE